MFTLTKAKAKKILIIEDDTEMHSMYKIFFSGQEDKYVVNIEPLARQALEKTRQGKYDLIILDIIMEPMPGDEFFIHLRDNVKTRNIPVLAVSVLNPTMLEDLKELGHIDFMQKPVTKDELFAKIEKLL